MEIIIAAMVEGILGVIFNQIVASRDERQGLQNALMTAFKQCKPDDVKLLEGYLSNDKAVHQELAKLLLVKGGPDPQILASIWESTYFPASTDFNIDDFLACFLPLAHDEIVNQPQLSDFIGNKQRQSLLDQAIQQTALLEKIAQNTQPASHPDSQPKTSDSQPPRAFAVTATFATTPEHIPDQPQQLIGRDALKAEVETLLRQGDEVLLLQGFGGMGKTALAATIAAQWVPEHGPVLWVKAGREVELNALFEGLARPFNSQQAMAQATTVDAKRDLLRQILVQSGATLFIVDDAWEGATLAPIQQAVPPNLPLLVTSRSRLTIGQIKPVGELDPPAALALLQRHAHADYANDEAAQTLCQTLGYHAYALEIAGKTLYVDEIIPAELLKQIAAAPHELAVPEDLALDERRSIADLIEVSLNALKTRDENAYTVFLTFGAFFAPSATPELLTLYFTNKPEISTEQIAQIKAIPKNAEASDEQIIEALQQHFFKNVETTPVENALRILARRGLAERVTADDRTIAHYRLHDLAYSYARAQNTDDHRQRAVAACVQYTNNYNQPSLENFAALRPEIENFMGAAKEAYRINTYEVLKQFASNLYIQGSEFFDLAGYYSEAVHLFNLGVEIAHNNGNHDDEGVSLGNLGIACRDLGQYEQAIRHLQRALDISRKTGDRKREGEHLGNLGNVYRNLGQYEQALDCLDLALTIQREIGDRSGQSNQLGNLGNVYADLGKYDQAIEHYQQARAISQDIGNRRGEGGDLGNLGNAYLDLGQVEQAIDYYQQSLVISLEIGDRRSEALSLGNLGNAYLDLGQVEQAIDYYQQALAIHREIGNLQGQGNELGSLGSAYRDLGRYEQAIDYHQEALAIHRKIGDRRGAGAGLCNMGNAYLDLGQVEQAIDYYQQALAIHRDIGDRHGEGNDLGNLGNAYRDLGQYEQAIDYYQQALAVRREIGDRHGEGSDLGNLGSAYTNLGQYDKAISYLQQALTIRRDIGDRRGESIDLNNIGCLYDHQGQCEQAIGYYQQARAIFVELGVQHLVEYVDRNIVIAQAKMAGADESEG